MAIHNTHGNNGLKFSIIRNHTNKYEEHNYLNEQDCDEIKILKEITNFMGVQRRKSNGRILLKII